MKLYQDKVADLNMITGYAIDHVMINKVRYDENLILQPSKIVTGWATGGFDALDEAQIARIAALEAEVVIIGTGARQRFPSPALLRPLISARIGFEIMDLGSACRTYNILAGEGRNAAAALILERS
ncbi:MAG: Mth938-like domain-containing protein [Rhodocyclaceae bacterium]|nr:Mth938-like domain-containing protein [Rhodocyclaceae bacterium]MCP5232104.1 Mth938-like domain-containing protein [Zoogloeaceae bacterium]MCB1910908.1 Mth938-like domain-containing protein [Rhodocyclaceae bacterium]MCP5238474.1 Mth938-like domain-containing protein [Zoogloeaceae bacterium]MCP5254612.1 Mth938-like domain-containing protein [Zoogloeaceae bacterium]